MRSRHAIPSRFHIARHVTPPTTGRGPESRRSRPRLLTTWPVATAILNLAAILTAGAVPAQESTVPAVEPAARPVRRQAFVGGTIVVSPGKTLPKGTLLVVDGIVVGVGEELPVPPGFTTYDMRRKVLQVGLFDAAFEPASDPAGPAEIGFHAKPVEGKQAAEAPLPEPSATNGTAHWNDLARPDYRVAAAFRPDAKRTAGYRGQGVTLQLVCPSARVVRGWGAICTTAEGDPRRRLLMPEPTLHVQQHPPLTQTRADGYPASPMGATSLIRQMLLDASWNSAAWDAFRAGKGTQPERNLGLETLGPLLHKQRTLIVHAPDELYVLRAGALAKEFGLPTIVRGSGREYRRAEEVEATKLPVILPVRLPSPPDVRSTATARHVTLERLLHWDHAPENAAVLTRAGVPILFGSHGLQSPEKFLPNLRRMVTRGLDRAAARAALTTVPAERFGLADRWGTLEPGKLAHVVVTDGDLFVDGTQVLEVWIDGEVHREQTPFEQLVRGAVWKIAPERLGKPMLIRLHGDPRKPVLHVRPWPQLVPGQELADPKPVKAEFVELLPQQLRFAVGERRFVLWWNGDKARGEAVDADGLVQPITAEAASLDLLPRAVLLSETDAKRARSQAEPASFPLRYPLGAFGREAPPPAAGTVVFRNATLWTVGPDGTRPTTDLRIENGKIAAIGPGLPVPAGVRSIDLTGKHVTPGMIDCHSHTATDGGINEPSHSSTAEVRIADFIDCDSVDIYRQLAGGLTTIHVLHGSANVIGGQDAVLKLRWGAAPERMKFEGAPPGIKFALGENVKQSNWGDRFKSRYPQTRMGVERFLRDRFEAAKSYAATQAAPPDGVPERRNLELEALAEVLAGKRLLHVHCYRQDEILMLLRVTKEYGVKVATLQHVLEGYKVADEIARHGAGASAFSDWWAYKLEAHEAIPWNGAMLHRSGVLVSFNSDWNELGRRMNVEATKAVRFGGISESEALAFVTLNPAKQLGIGDRVGSLEVGKDADLVVWSGSPLDPRSRCERTWIDGRPQFSLEEDQALRAKAVAMKGQLVRKALASGEEPGEEPLDEKARWPRFDRYCTTSERQE